MGNITDSLNKKFGVSGSNIADALDQISGVFGGGDISEAVDRLSGSVGTDLLAPGRYTDTTNEVSVTYPMCIDVSHLDGDSFSSIQDFYASEEFNQLYNNLDPEFEKCLKWWGFTEEVNRKIVANTAWSILKWSVWPNETDFDFLGSYDIRKYDLPGCYENTADNIFNDYLSIVLGDRIEEPDGPEERIWVLVECCLSDSSRFEEPLNRPYGGWFRYLDRNSTLNKKVRLTEENVAVIKDEFGGDCYYFYVPARLNQAETFSYSGKIYDLYAVSLGDDYAPILIQLGDVVVGESK